MTIYQALKSFEPNVEVQETFLKFYVKSNMVDRKRQKCPFDYSIGSEFWFWRFFSNYLELQLIKLKIHSLELYKMVIFEAPKSNLPKSISRKNCDSVRKILEFLHCVKATKSTLKFLSPFSFSSRIRLLRLASTCLEQRGTPPLWIIVLDSNRRAHDGWRMEIGTGTNVYVYALYSIVIYEFTFTQFQSEDGRTSF